MREFVKYFFDLEFLVYLIFGFIIGVMSQL